MLKLYERYRDMLPTCSCIQKRYKRRKIEKKTSSLDPVNS